MSFGVSRSQWNALRGWAPIGFVVAGSAALIGGIAIVPTNIDFIVLGDFDGPLVSLFGMVLALVLASSLLGLYPRFRKSAHLLSSFGVSVVLVGGLTAVYLTIALSTLVVLGGDVTVSFGRFEELALSVTFVGLILGLIAFGIAGLQDDRLAKSTVAGLIVSGWLLAIIYLETIAISTVLANFHFVILGLLGIALLIVGLDLNRRGT